MLEACPCGRGDYHSCCQPLHLAVQKASSAEQLMRSRYSAFAKQQIRYIQATTALGQQANLDLPALAAWSTSNQWHQLELLEVNEKLDKQHAMVEFKAYYVHDGQAEIHHERSYFVKRNEQWYFLDPTLALPSMKQPCICGSDKKFKQCCAQFL